MRIIKKSDINYSGRREDDGEERIMSLGKKIRKIIHTQAMLTASPFAVFWFPRVCDVNLRNADGLTLSRVAFVHSVEWPPVRNFFNA